ncbi:DUF805 domain-containing protein [Amorphus orientalis]|uniref:Uncharacterized membrane protein YhaH (DUF805 family) n=1 Tax=Amorphus orientalis TaxID=649198 RepID=A0AAE3VQT3_9HYPH|nr:DUF805 domain-containing protein [Amorphus orientalis]MDQ0316652.1 uncharacterized membrane protein YhaH (DUF805 family) [Amorphus orientalis]
MNQVRQSQTKISNVIWVVFGFDGRISREPYWLGFLLVSLLASIALTPYRPQGDEQVMMDAGFLVILCVALWSELALVVKRLHDRGLSGWFAALLFVPLLNLVVFIVLGLLPGEKGPNAFGPAPNTRKP